MNLLAPPGLMAPDAPIVLVSAGSHARGAVGAVDIGASRQWFKPHAETVAHALSDPVYRIGVGQASFSAGPFVVDAPEFEPNCVEVVSGLICGHVEIVPSDDSV